MPALENVKYWCHKRIWSDKQFTKFYVDDGIQCHDKLEVSEEQFFIFC